MAFVSSTWHLFQLHTTHSEDGLLPKGGELQGTKAWTSLWGPGQAEPAGGGAGP